ncbi:MAG: glycoside hydrolase family 2 TIM barrel-domain containing protein [Blautia sp.]|nr:beta-galactosidase [Blautia sp.]MDY3998163.1 glycoside hydrolase family 2 TIM barrel-domain containing protein [Blautia sp.]
METIVQLSKGWKILQDVHNIGEQVKLFEKWEADTEVGSQISEWEELKELKHLQLIYAQQPYFGRELRYFNEAPWWYMLEFEVPCDEYKSATLHFTNVDYYGKVWLNGVLLGEHEGYSTPFSFETINVLKPDEKNYLIVKVSSPWDEEVELNEEASRTHLVKRNMVKGTYEHSDTFIQRDVNPVGIYGEVFLMLNSDAVIEERPEFVYSLDEKLCSADIIGKIKMNHLTTGHSYKVIIRIREKNSGLVVVQTTDTFSAEGISDSKSYGMHLEKVKLWNTWDHGYPWMYEAEVLLEDNEKCVCIRKTNLAFRKTEIERTKEITRFWINRKKFFVRGTSYYPDCYISAMTEERYLRDLLNIKAAGFNLVRVHVHTEKEIFYDLCDRLGIVVLQDSEYNWTHPSTDEWADRFVNIYRENVKMLKNHPSLICWIIMNEPGCVDPDGKTRERFMEENPGPRLYREVSEMDPERPIIKGSFCENDIFSGDSHNYLGSLSSGLYEDIYEQKEKLNTEYGFDAPGSAENLKKVPAIQKRFGELLNHVSEIQEYQYKLLKYYTEHYRIQKYSPCSGYVQFMFIDLCPQSFYGVYDWWGIPKKGLNAILESNMPMGVFAKYKDSLEGIYVVNDKDREYTDCTVHWVIIDADTGEVVEQNQVKIDVNEDCCLKVKEFPEDYGKERKWNLSLTLTDSQGKCLAANSYTDIFHLLKRVKGHPERMSHEIGMRLYWA